MSEEKAYLAQSIRYLRKKRGISQEELADMFGYKPYMMIQKWETGKGERGDKQYRCCNHPDSAKAAATLPGVLTVFFVSIIAPITTPEDKTKQPDQTHSARIN